MNDFLPFFVYLSRCYESSRDIFGALGMDFFDLRLTQSLDGAKISLSFGKWKEEPV